MTTHIPGLANLLPVDSLRLVERGGTRTTVRSGGDDVYEAVVHTLGVVPDRRARVLICVEGPHDVAFLRNVCRLIRSAGEDIVDIESDHRIATVVLGGSTLEQWVSEHFLRNLRIPEFHVYDRDPVGSRGRFHYEDAVNEVNARGGNHSARLTTKREMENYLHVDAIDRVLTIVAGVPVRPTFGDFDDVEGLVSRCVLDQNGNPQRKLQRRSLKSWLNNEVAGAMTQAELRDRDPADEILEWFVEITRLSNL